MKTLLFSISMAVALAFSAVASDNVTKGHSTDWAANLEAATYGTANWDSLGGKPELGVGVYLQNSFTKNVALRLSGEADKEKFNDYVVDRVFVDIVVNAPIETRGFSLYGIGGLGYSLGDEVTRDVKTEEGDSSRRFRENEFWLIRAGLGFKARLIKLGSAELRLFGQGTIWTSTESRHGAGLAAGLSLGGS